MARFLTAAVIALGAAALVGWGTPTAAEDGPERCPRFIA
jgi:hypothetical protein